ncbi:DUF421 domain-containing protein [Bacillus sp. AGMB 02131]|uniref:DUF421 domain-containing protein n=1 Tax=Peribacillus faecalis TaxID=2772559 RepID=A0A927CYV8_9BACI|nr:DUF421 domain-containing protein [Peribacillus faecalis]MBD3107864.1 DUF421 domain-containing protein [Peribacillus faecalis]
MNELIIIIFRTIFMYALIIIIFRLMGKREIGEMSLLDLGVFLMLAELAAVAIEDINVTLIEAIVPMVSLMIIQITLAIISLKIPKFRKLLDGKPTIIIHNGKVDEKAMKTQRYNFDDMLLQLREQNIFTLSEVDYAILEPSGKLSVLKKSTGSEKEATIIPLPLILDGIIQVDNLRYFDIREEWLVEQLRQNGYHDYRKISYCSLYRGVLTIDLIDE